MKQYDCIIVGAGLAGSVLAYQFIQQNQSVLIIDRNKGTTSSTKAAGIINPITGKRFIKTWLLEDILPVAQHFYRSASKHLHYPFINELTAYRAISSTEQLNDVSAKMHDPKYQSYLGATIKPFLPNQFNNDLGSVAIKQVLQINTKILLESFHRYFQNKACLIEAQFDVADLKINHDAVYYKELNAKHIVFAEGYLLNQNPLFQYLPIRPVKGEALIIEANELELNTMFNGPATVSPWENNQHYVGATYDWKDRSFEPTEEKRSFLENNLSRFLKIPYTVKEQITGIRPGTLDRRPFIGAHPKYNNVHMFNGMGTKGLSLTPYFAQQLINNIMFQEPIHPEANIRRFANRYES